MLEVNIETSFGHDSPYEFKFVGQLSDTEKRFASALFNSFLNTVGKDPRHNEFTLSGYLEDTRFEFDNMSDEERCGFDSLDAALKEVHDEQKKKKD